MKKGKLIIIELVVLVLVLGLLALVGVQWFQEHQRKARTAEAIVGIDQMFEAAVISLGTYNTCSSWIYCAPSAYLPPDKEWTPPLGTCGSSGCIFGENVAPAPEIFWNDKTWGLLNFRPEDPFYYSYRFISCDISTPDVELTEQEIAHFKSLQASGRRGGWMCKADTSISCEASGDLDGDGRYSLFKRRGQIVNTPGVGLELKSDPGIYKRDPLE